jgi:hypothetical protein
MRAFEVALRSPSFAFFTLFFIILNFLSCAHLTWHSGRLASPLSIIVQLQRIETNVSLISAEWYWDGVVCVDGVELRAFKSQLCFVYTKSPTCCQRWTRRWMTCTEGDSMVVSASNMINGASWWGRKLKQEQIPNLLIGCYADLLYLRSCISGTCN